MLPTTVGGHTNIDVLAERFEAITKEPLGEFEQILVRREGRDRHGDYLDALKYAIDTAIVFRTAEGWPTGFSILGPDGPVEWPINTLLWTRSWGLALALPPPALRERRHRRLACRRAAVRRRAILMVAEGERNFLIACMAFGG
jgi:hypothetical protein